MRVLHISAECYPAAKSGGLADVAGALPKYLSLAGWESAVVMPKYGLPWIRNQPCRLVHVGAFVLHGHYHPYTIEEPEEADLGFSLYLMNFPSLFQRPGIYGDPDRGWYTDNPERFTMFQLAVLDWLKNRELRPEVLHCHDHHAGLVPFLVQYAPDFEVLRNIPTVFTIHNAEYPGAFPWSKRYLLPDFHAGKEGLLDWSGYIHPLAAAIKCAWAITTVSPGYLEELQRFSSGLEWLFRQEISKCQGILNGIDTEVWNPEIDPLLERLLRAGGVNSLEDIEDFKSSQKKGLQYRLGLNPQIPWITFIGRLVREKGADMLPDLIHQLLSRGAGIGFIVLGSGELHLHERLHHLSHRYPGNVHVHVGYDEELAHRLYAASDFLFMPSRVEPCGLNQFYALRYGTIPIVRAIGGLKDSIKPWQQVGGNGILFQRFSLQAAAEAILEAMKLFHDKNKRDSLRQSVMRFDFSWHRSAAAYISLYERIT